ncbi:MAG TPA: hypothetical protein VFT22_01265 [Kofleriaceae bacterium]|nr:hypothetical protein [Kofleriaceae bacterium]
MIYRRQISPAEQPGAELAQGDCVFAFRYECELPQPDLTPRVKQELVAMNSVLEDLSGPADPPDMP